MFKPYHYFPLRWFRGAVIEFCYHTRIFCHLCTDVQDGLGPIKRSGALEGGRLSIPSAEIDCRFNAVSVFSAWPERDCRRHKRSLRSHLPRASSILKMVPRASGDDKDGPTITSSTIFETARSLSVNATGLARSRACNWPRECYAFDTDYAPGQTSGFRTKRQRIGFRPPPSPRPLLRCLRPHKFLPALENVRTSPPSLPKKEVFR
jgi:hypothetical protein